MKVWLITGTSKGFGRIWAEAALSRGDRVVATARDPKTLIDLKAKYGDLVLPFALDVTDRSAAFDVVRQAHEHFGRLDVIVNNAGYGQFGAIEELSEREARDQLETNFFGALWVTQAALPFLRAQKSGHILQVSSIGGVHAFAGIGMYHASKWGLEGFSQALAQEVGPLGIHVTIIEPVGYATDWSGPSKKTAVPLPAYEPLWEARRKLRQKAGKPGDPAATASVVLRLVDLPEPPLRLFLGATANATIHTEYEKRLAEWDQYNSWSIEAHGL